MNQYFFLTRKFQLRIETLFSFYQKQAIEILSEEELEAEKLVSKIRQLLKDKKKMKELGQNARQLMEWGAEERIAELILRMGEK